MKKTLTITLTSCPLGCLGSLFLVVILMIGMLSMLSSCGPQFLQGTAGLDSTLALGNDFPPLVALDAVALASHLSGHLLQNYDPSDPFMQRVIAFWRSTCRDDKGGLCKAASNGDLQCVEFVTGAFALAGISLPYVSDAHFFWSGYQNKALQSDWREIRVGTGLPQMGDIVVWRSWHYDFKRKVRVEDPGHVAIVVAVVAPSGNRPGKAYLAQANAPSSITVREALTQDASGALVNALDPTTLNARLGMLTIFPDLSVGDSKSVENIPTSHGAVVFGYIRHNFAAAWALWLSRNQTCSTAHMPHIVQPQWVPVACADALKYHIGSQYFLNQIYLESHFNPEAVSDKNAEGIAQFEPATAAGLGINPFDPVAALDASAHLMSNYYCGYLSGDFVGYVHGKKGLSDCDKLVAASLPAQRSEAYEKALAAYNGGPGAVSGAVARCGDARWFNCLGKDIQFYINYIATL